MLELACRLASFPDPLPRSTKTPNSVSSELVQIGADFGFVDRIVDLLRLLWGVAVTGPQTAAETSATKRRQPW
jgi:hypothetical protein